MRHIAGALVCVAGLANLYGCMVTNAYWAWLLIPVLVTLIGLIAACSPVDKESK